MINPKENLKLFGGRLRQGVKKAGLSTRDLDEMFGNHSKIYSYMSGKAYPNAYTLAMLAKTLNVSADWLLGMKEDVT